MGVRRGWLSLLAVKPHGWDGIFKAFDAVREFVDNLEEQVKFVRRGPHSSHSTMSEGAALEEAFKKLKDEIAEKRRSAVHWLNVDQEPESYGRGTFTQDQGTHMRQLYEEKFGELLTTFVPTKVNKKKDQWNKTRMAPITELLDDVLEILRKDAARLQEAIQTEEHIVDRGGEIDSPTKEVFQDPTFKEFEIGHMKVVVTDPKGNGHYIRPYVRLLDIAHQLTAKKGFGNLWYGVLFLESSSDYKQLSESERASYERSGYHDLKSTAGEFHSGDDHVVITAPPDDRTIKTIVHELGHRYWFKFMSATQRARFADLIRVHTPALLRAPIDAQMLEEDRKQILAIGTDRKRVLKDFEDDFRSSANSAEVEKVIKDYEPKFLQMLFPGGKDPLFEVMRTAFQPMIYGGDPKEQRLYDSVNEVMKRYTGQEEGAGVKFRHHLHRDSLQGAWKRGMSDGVNKWIREAFKLHFEMEEAALDYIHHLGTLAVPKLDPDDSRVMPVSEYGKTNPEEAFAEAFAFYVMGHEMTRDQSEMFRSVLSSEDEHDAIMRKIDALPKLEGHGCAASADCVSAEDVFSKPVVHAIYGFKRKHEKLFVKTTVAAKDVYPVQEFLNRDVLKQYVKHPPAELPIVVQHTDGRLFAQNHTRIAAQILKGATHVSVRLIEYTGLEDEPYKKPSKTAALGIVHMFLARGG